MFRRFPQWNQVIAVYSLIVLLIQGWSGYWYLWKLPSWLKILPLDDILTASAHLIIITFLESGAVLVAVLVAALVLPRSWLHQDFLFRGSSIVLVSLPALMIISGANFSIQQAAVCAALGGLCVWLLIDGGRRYPGFRSIIESLAIHANVLLYITVPASLMATALVLVRNVLVRSGPP